MRRRGKPLFGRNGGMRTLARRQVFLEDLGKHDLFELPKRGSHGS